MNARIFALVLVAIGTALVLGGSVVGGLLLVLLGVLWGIASFIPFAKSDLQELVCGRDIEISQKAFAKCLEDFFQGQHFCFESFDSIAVYSIGANRFLCEIKMLETAIIAYGIVDFTTTFSDNGHKRVVVHASAGSMAKVTSYSIEQVASYWEKTAIEPLLQDSNEPWECV